MISADQQDITYVMPGLIPRSTDDIALNGFEIRGTNLPISTDYFLMMTTCDCLSKRSSIPNPGTSLNTLTAVSPSRPSGTEVGAE